MPGPGLIYFAVFIVIALLFFITVIATISYAVTGKKAAYKGIILVFLEVGAMIFLCYVGGENYLDTFENLLGR
ncbi:MULTISPECIES: hypothetical protein [Bacillus subtilis group]|uniref:hypothetical protein n=1 Tax=Bacillus subtilis group TaxID=653685 RepID=UPI001B9C8AA1|nr:MULTISPECIES: hypothetical protein [Bacillus subtilis group]MEC2189671.1 hypothetical protein [Bacillus spizizenii]MEC2297048.1 hypothetical protein [Bacillus subtilis]MEC2403628.1 hypothetical protein [Bacillus subtilis]MED4660916.1 hypothetical protein [Bacillus subtilis]MED4667495.1 hypothetical protein [Bacillus subtilis]